MEVEQFLMCTAAGHCGWSTSLTWGRASGSHLWNGPSFSGYYDNGYQNHRPSECGSGEWRHLTLAKEPSNRSSLMWIGFWTLDSAAFDLGLKKLWPWFWQDLISCVRCSKVGSPFLIPFWSFIIWTVTYWVRLGSHLGSDRSGCLAQHWETSQVLNCVSFLGNFLVQRGIQREHQRFHFIFERALQNTKIQKRMYNNLTCYVFTDCSQHAPAVTVLSQDDDITLTSAAPFL